MNILLAMTEFVILAPLKPYICPFLAHFVALKTNNFRNGTFKTPPNGLQKLDDNFLRVYMDL